MSEINPECEAVREEFSALLDGELPAAELEGVEAHLADCGACLRALNRLKRVDDAYAGLSPVRAPEDFEARVHDAIRPAPARRFPIRPVLGALFAAAAVLIVVAVWPRTAVAPGDGAFQLSKSVDERPEEGPATEEAKAAADAAGPGSPGPVQEVPVEPETGDGDTARDFADDAAAAAPAPQALRMENAEPGRRAGGSEGELRERFEAGARQAAPGAVASAPRMERNAGEAESAAKAQVTEASEADDAVSLELGGVREETPLASRSFDVRDGVWYERGYAGEDVQEVARDSDLLQELIERDASVAELTENDSRIVFKVDERWYALAAKAQGG